MVYPGVEAIAFSHDVTFQPSSFISISYQIEVFHLVEGKLWMCEMTR